MNLEQLVERQEELNKQLQELSSKLHRINDYVLLKDAEVVVTSSECKKSGLLADLQNKQDGTQYYIDRFSKELENLYESIYGDLNESDIKIKHEASL